MFFRTLRLSLKLFHFYLFLYLPFIFVHTKLILFPALTPLKASIVVQYQHPFRSYIGIIASTKRIYPVLGKLFKADSEQIKSPILETT
jgi:hypothetical protein